MIQVWSSFNQVETRWVGGGEKSYLNPDCIVIFAEQHPGLQRIMIATQISADQLGRVAYFEGTPAELVKQMREWKALGGLGAGR